MAVYVLNLQVSHRYSNFDLLHQALQVSHCTAHNVVRILKQDGFEIVPHSDSVLCTL